MNFTSHTTVEFLSKSGSLPFACYNRSEPIVLLKQLDNSEKLTVSCYLFILFLKLLCLCQTMCAKLFSCCYSPIMFRVICFGRMSLHCRALHFQRDCDSWSYFTSSSTMCRKWQLQPKQIQVDGRLQR